MKKTKAYLNLSNSSATAVRMKAKTIVSKMTGNATFPTPDPTLAVVLGFADAIALKQSEQEAAFLTYQQKTLELNNEKDNTLNALDTLGAYVEKMAGNDEAKIISAGYEIKQTATPIGILDAPINLLAKEGHGTGELVCSWKSVKGAKAYEVQQSFDITDANSWEHVQTVTKAKCTVSGLTAGAKIWFRIAAIGAAGKSAYSDVTTRVIP